MKKKAAPEIGKTVEIEIPRAFKCDKSVDKEEENGSE